MPKYKYDGSLPFGLQITGRQEITRKNVLAELVDIDYSTFKKSKEERLILKIAKAQAKGKT